MSYSDVSILVSSCDLYEDAWNPFFRLLQANWEDCPRTVFLNTESKEYSDSFFDVRCIHSNNKLKWGARLINCLKQIDSEYILFFLEDFFIEKKVNVEIINEAYKCIKENENVGVIKFIPNITQDWYDKDKIINRFFSPIPKNKKARSNLMISLYKKDYFLKMLRANETPWDFEKFGTYRSRRYNELILVQTNDYDIAFPFNYQIKYGYGISNKQWLPNNKALFQRYDIVVNYDNLGWYDNNCKKKITGLKRSKKEKILMPIKQPKQFWQIVLYETKNKLYSIRHIRNYF